MLPDQPWPPQQHQTLLILKSASYKMPTRQETQGKHKHANRASEVLKEASQPYGSCIHLSPYQTARQHKVRIEGKRRHASHSACAFPRRLPALQVDPVVLELREMAADLLQAAPVGL